MIKVTDKPLISILIPVYNGEKWLRACLDSCFKQTIAESVDIVVVDDGSEDSTRAILEELEPINENLRFVSTKNVGTAKARKRCVELSYGSFIFFLDSDDLITPNALALLYKKQQEGNYDLVVSQHQVVRRGKEYKKYKPYAYKKGDSLIRSFLKQELPVSTCGSLFRKEIIQKAIGDGNLGVRSIGEDFIIMSRLYTIENLTVATMKDIVYINIYNPLSNSKKITESKITEAYEAYEIGIKHLKEKVNNKYLKEFCTNKILFFYRCSLLVNSQYCEEMLRDIKKEYSVRIIKESLRELSVVRFIVILVCLKSRIGIPLFKLIILNLKRIRSLWRKSIEKSI